MTLGLARQDAAEHVMIDVPTGQHHPDLLSVHPVTLLEQCGQRRRSGAFCNVVCVDEVGAHGTFNVVVGDGHDSISPGPDDFQGFRIRLADCDPIGNGRRRWMLNNMASIE